jgi:tetratricopeptide (TPR) repeat protein
VERSVIPILGVLAVPFGVIGSLGVVGLALTLRRPQAQPIWILLGVGLFACMVFYTSSRFRMPTVPLLAILGGWGIDVAAGWWQRGARACVAYAVGTECVLAVLMLWPVGGDLPSPELFGRRNLASMLARSGQVDRALEILRPQLQPGTPEDDRAEAYLCLGRIRLESRQYAQAVDAFQSAMKLDPKNFAPYRDLAKTYYFLGRYDNAIENAESMLRHNPRDLESRGVIAQCHLRRKEWTSAAAELEVALKLDPRNPITLQLLGQAYAGAHQYRQAADVLRRSLALRSDTEVMLNLAICLKQLDEIDQAERLLARILSTNPDHAAARGLLKQLGGPPTGDLGPRR